MREWECETHMRKILDVELILFSQEYICIERLRIQATKWHLLWLKMFMTQQNFSIHFTFLHWSDYVWSLMLLYIKTAQFNSSKFNRKSHFLFRKIVSGILCINDKHKFDIWHEYSNASMEWICKKMCDWNFSH